MCGVWRAIDWHKYVAKQRNVRSRRKKVYLAKCSNKSTQEAIQYVRFTLGQLTSFHPNLVMRIVHDDRDAVSTSMSHVPLLGGDWGLGCSL